MIVKTLRTFNPDPVHWLHKTFKFHIAFRDIHSQAPRWNIFHFHFIPHKVGRIYTFQHCCARQYRAVARQQHQLKMPELLLHSAQIYFNIRMDTLFTLLETDFILTRAHLSSEFTAWSSLQLPPPPPDIFHNVVTPHTCNQRLGLLDRYHCRKNIFYFNGNP